MTSIKTLLATGIASLALAGCNWGTELGHEIDEGGFGNPTMNNTLVHNGERSASLALAQRFANEVPNTINFAFDKATVTPEAKLALNEQANFIKQFPELKFSVFGHTDLVGSSGYNQALGRRRAQATVNYLVSQGVERGQLQALVSFGKTKPLIQTTQRELRNRRTVTEVAGFLAGNPFEIDGKYAQIIYREYVESATQKHSLGALTGTEGE
jgi:outer membrane protein OmpA-like peptidoglycan-associated protein